MDHPRAKELEELANNDQVLRNGLVGAASAARIQRIAAAQTPAVASTDKTSEPQVAETPEPEAATPPLALLRGPAPLPRAHPLAHIRRMAYVRPVPKPGSDTPQLVAETRTAPHGETPEMPLTQTPAAPVQTVLNEAEPDVPPPATASPSRSTR